MKEIIDINEFINCYEDSIIPSYFVQNFKTKKQFIKWLELGSINDLKELLKVFTEEELYEHCSIIKEFLNKKLT